MKRVLLFFYIVTFIMLAEGCSQSMFTVAGIHADTGGTVTNALKMNRSKLMELPSFDSFSPRLMQVDLRSCDLTSLKLDDKYDVLSHADFDTRTIWPYRLPEGFDPKLVMKYGKDPGLNIRKLHSYGITGDGVGIAIIGGAILAEHREYSANLKLYDDTRCFDKTATTEGCTAISVAAGITAGVAPEADVYYIAETPAADSAGAIADIRGDTGVLDDGELQAAKYAPLADSIFDIIKINAAIPKEDRIRVICINEDIRPASPEYASVLQAVDNAKREGMFVVSNALYETYNEEMSLNGLGRNPMKDPGSTASYGPGLSWANDFYTFARYSRTKEALLVPMDSRCAAAPTGAGDYAFYSSGAPCASMGYIAGIYALMCQAKPDLTPEAFWRAALETGDSVTVGRNNIDYGLSKIINPLRLYDKIGAPR